MSDIEVEKRDQLYNEVLDFIKASTLNPQFIPLNPNLIPLKQLYEIIDVSHDFTNDEIKTILNITVRKVFNTNFSSIDFSTMDEEKYDLLLNEIKRFSKLLIFIIKLGKLVFPSFTLTNVFQILNRFTIKIFDKIYIKIYYSSIDEEYDLLLNDIKEIFLSVNLIKLESNSYPYPLSDMEIEKILNEAIEVVATEGYEDKIRFIRSKMIEKMNESYRLKLIESQFKSIIKSISDHFSEVEIITLIEKFVKIDELSGLSQYDLEQRIKLLKNYISFLPTITELGRSFNHKFTFDEIIQYLDTISLIEDVDEKLRVIHKLILSKSEYNSFKNSQGMLWNKDEYKVHDLVLYIYAHGCEDSSISIRSKVGQEFYNTIFPIMIFESPGFTCVNLNDDYYSTQTDESDNFNSEQKEEILCSLSESYKEKSLDGLTELALRNEIKQGLTDKLSTKEYDLLLLRFKKIQKINSKKYAVRPGIEHNYYFYYEKNLASTPKEQNARRNRGIFVAYSTMKGFFDETCNILDKNSYLKKNILQKQNEPENPLAIIKQTEIQPGTDYEVVKLSSILNQIHTWFRKEYPEYKLNLIIYDTSCRTDCTTAPTIPLLKRTHSVNEALRPYGFGMKSKLKKKEKKNKSKKVKRTKVKK